MQESAIQQERGRFFGKVEKVKAHAEEVVHETGESSEAASQRKSWSGALRAGPKSSQGMRKNVWEVRRK